VKRTAKLSDCGTYRYSLARTWDPSIGAALFVCLNPSTADHAKDDPTVRKCVGFATRWGFGAMWIVNLFAYRATDPKELRAAQKRGVDIVGNPANQCAIDEAAAGAGRIVLAWGANATLWTPYTQAVVRSIRRSVVGTAPLWHLGLTGDRQPRHPLMLAYSTHLQQVGEANDLSREERRKATK
jgi:hypothetical protein